MVAVIVKNEVERRVSGFFLLFGHFEGTFERQDQTEEIQTYLLQDEQQLRW